MLKTDPQQEPAGIPDWVFSEWVHVTLVYKGAEHEELSIFLVRRYEGTGAFTLLFDEDLVEISGQKLPISIPGLEQICRMVDVIVTDPFGPKVGEWRILRYIHGEWA
jgi:hypothetical protein